MTRPPRPVPTLPRAAACALRPLPLAPLGPALSALAGRLARRHPGLFRRLGPHGRKRFLIDPTDLPFALLLDLSSGQPRIGAHRGRPAADARIAGTLGALLGMVHGAYDGDALFFSRDLTVEGDTAAALALRNAIDDAELDLAAEIAQAVGPLGAPLRPAAGLLSRLSGIAFARADAVRP